MSGGGGHGSVGDQVNTGLNTLFGNDDAQDQGSALNLFHNIFVKPLSEIYKTVSGQSEQTQQTYNANVISNANTNQQATITAQQTAAQTADTNASSGAAGNLKAAAAASLASSQNNFNWATPKRSDTGDFLGF
jgi:hypothetical protein